MSSVRQAWVILTRRYLRELYRQPAVIFMALLQPVITIIQSAIIIAIGWGTGATFGGGAVGVTALIAVSVLIALAMAGLSSAFALLTRQREALIGASTTLVLPLTFLSGAFLSLRLVPRWIAGVARYNPVNWAASAGRIAVAGHAAWTTVGSYAGLLAVAVAITAATRAFRAYQRSL